MYGNPVWDNKTVYTVGDEVNCIYTVWMNEFNGQGGWQSQTTTGGLKGCEGVYHN